VRGGRETWREAAFKRSRRVWKADKGPTRREGRLEVRFGLGERWLQRIGHGQRGDGVTEVQYTRLTGWPSARVDPTCRIYGLRNTCISAQMVKGTWCCRTKNCGVDVVSRGGG